jgi:hypothetical protein
VRLGHVEPPGPYGAVVDLLAADPRVREAAAMATWHEGVNAMDLLRCDDVEWQLWRALTRLEREAAGSSNGEPAR